MFTLQFARPDNFLIFDLLNLLTGYNFSPSPYPRLQVTKHLFFRFAYPQVTDYRRTSTYGTVLAMYRILAFHLTLII